MCAGPGSRFGQYTHLLNKTDSQDGLSRRKRGQAQANICNIDYSLVDWHDERLMDGQYI